MYRLLAIAALCGAVFAPPAVGKPQRPEIQAPIVQAACLAVTVDGSVVVRRPCVSRGGVQGVCDVGELEVSVGDLDLVLTFCNYDVPRLLALGCKIESDSINRDMSRRCQGSSNTCAAGPLGVNIRGTSVSINFCTEHPVPRGGQDPPREPRSALASLISAACEVSDGSGNVVKSQECPDTDTCSLGPLSVPRGDQTYTAKFCASHARRILAMARREACEIESKDFPSMNIDRPEECRGDDNTCGLGPLFLSTEDGSAEVTFCSQPLFSSDVPPPPPRPDNPLISAACEVSDGSGNVVKSQECPDTDTCSLGPLSVPRGDQTYTAKFCASHARRILAMARREACEIESKDFPSMNIDRPEVCRGDDNTCGLGPLFLSTEDGSAEVTFCTQPLFSSDVPPSPPRPDNPLISAACEVSDGSGNVVKSQECPDTDTCSLGHLKVPRGDQTYTVKFCASHARRILAMARREACEIESKDFPSINIDRPEVCRGDDNTCGLGPLYLDTEDGSAEVTFCTQPLLSSDVPPPPPRPDNSLISAACEVADGSSNVIKSQECPDDDTCSLGPLIVPRGDQTYTVKFCASHTRRILDVARREACKIDFRDFPSMNIDRPEVCRGDDNTCGLGPLYLDTEDGSAEVTFCTQPLLSSNVPPPPRPGNPLISAACEVTDGSGNVVKSEECPDDDTCSLGPLKVPRGDQTFTVKFCAIHIRRILAVARREACKIDFRDFPSMNIDRPEVCRGDDNICGLGPLYLDTEEGSAEVTFCTQQLFSSDVPPPRPRRDNPLISAACEVSDGSGNVIKSEECPDDDTCSLGPLKVPTGDQTYTVKFCASHARRILDVARRKGCKIESRDFPSINIDRPEVCRGDDNTCGVGPLSLSTEDGSAEVTFCTQSPHSSDVPTRPPRPENPLISAACEVADGSGNVIKSQECPDTDTCSLGPLSVPRGNKMFAVQFCASHARRILAMARTLACRIKSEDNPNLNRDSPDKCKGDDNTCSMGPLTLEINNGGPVEVTFCTGEDTNIQNPRDPRPLPPQPGPDNPLVKAACEVMDGDKLTAKRDCRGGESCSLGPINVEVDDKTYNIKLCPSQQQHILAMAREYACRVESDNPSLNAARPDVCEGDENICNTGPFNIETRRGDSIAVTFCTVLSIRQNSQSGASDREEQAKKETDEEEERARKQEQEREDRAREAIERAEQARREQEAERIRKQKQEREDRAREARERAEQARREQEEERARPRQRDRPARARGAGAATAEERAGREDRQREARGRARPARTPPGGR